MKFKLGIKALSINAQIGDLEPFKKGIQKDQISTFINLD